MLTDFLLFIPFCVQMGAIGIDEFYFHLKRGLPRWERIGHPLDTLSILACLVFIFLVPFSFHALKTFILLAVISCVLITKDEFIHKHHCPAAEQWLHALLFINHPLMLVCMGMLWPLIDDFPSPSWISVRFFAPDLYFFLLLQAVLVTVFFLYQVVYWNFLWKEKRIV